MLVHLFEVLSNYASLDIPDTGRRRRLAPEPGAVRELKQPNRKLSPAESAQLAKTYRDGLSILGLGRQFGMHEQTVRAHLKRHGVALRPKLALTEDQVADAGRLYALGWTITEIAEQLGCSYSTLRATLHRAGVQVRPRGRLSGS